MIKLIFMFTFITAAYSSSKNLSGLWLRSSAQYNEEPIEFVLINKEFRAYAQEKFYWEYGGLSHTIDQSIRVNRRTLKGFVDFYDSRGCSFKSLSVSMKIENINTISALMKVPRYQVIKVWSYPQYSWRPSTYLRTECRLIDYVEVATRLYRY